MTEATENFSKSELLISHVECEELAQLQKLLHEMSTDELVYAVSNLDSEIQRKLLALLPPETAAQIVHQLPEVQAVEIMESLDCKEAAKIINELSSSEQADILGELEEHDAEQIIAQMHPEEAKDARHLVSYDSESAGGLMITEFLAFTSDTQVKEVIAELGSHGDKYQKYDVQYLYVIGNDGTLRGVLPLRKALLSHHELKISEIMVKNPLSLSESSNLDDLRSFFEKHTFYGVPVVNASGKLLGVIRKSAVLEAFADKIGTDHLKSQGIIGGDEIRTMPLYTRSTRRLSWLSVNIVLNLISASVIAIYQDTLSSVIALAVFLPIISDMSGCSGNQAVAVSMRELALGVTKPIDIIRVLFKELSVGLINGIALGILIAGVAYFWKGNLYLGLIIGVALALNTVVAVCLGGSLPLILKRLDKDPALASGPILTTVTDMCGFFLVLSFASFMLSKIA
jgi:magnesium transporter